MGEGRHYCEWDGGNSSSEKWALDRKGDIIITWSKRNFYEGLCPCCATTSRITKVGKIHEESKGKRYSARNSTRRSSAAGPTQNALDGDPVKLKSEKREGFRDKED